VCCGSSWCLRKPALTAPILSSLQVYLEIDIVKKAIDVEVDERARSEESIVNSLEHYQTLLQKAVALINADVTSTAEM